MTFTRALATNNYGPAKFIVDGTTTANGTHSTIAAALTSASSGDTIFIRPGTYTENLTLKAGVNLTAFGSDSSLNATGKVIISGTCTMTTAGSVTISGIQLQTNSAALLAVTGSAASVVNLENCYLNMTNNTGITFSSSSASAIINVYRCIGNLGTTGIALFSHSSAGTLLLEYSKFDNSGASTTASTSSAGATTIFYTFISSPFTTSGTAALSLDNSTINSGAQNVTAFTNGGSGSSTASNCFFISGSASAVSISSTLTMTLCSVDSTNTNAVTGAGTLINAGISFINTSSVINTTTQTARNIDVGGISFDGGTNNLSSYTTGTWTPAFSSTSLNITYTVQVAAYTRIGNVVHYSITIQANAITNGGSGTLTITGLPFTSRNTTNLNHAAALGQSNFNMGGAISQTGWYNAPNTTTLIFSGMTVSTGAFTNAHTIATNEFIEISGFFLV